MVICFIIISITLHVLGKGGVLQVSHGIIPYRPQDTHVSPGNAGYSTLVPLDNAGLPHMTPTSGVYSRQYRSHSLLGSESSSIQFTGLLPFLHYVY